MKTGKTLRNEGIAQVLENEDSAWKEEAYAVIETLAAKGKPFTSEDVWAGVTSEPHHPNCMGAVMNSAVHKLKLVKQGYQSATRRNAHARVLAVWGIA